MDVKSIPTDSMYKFLSIFFISLLLASTYAVVTVNNSYMDRITNLYSKILILENKKKDQEKNNKELSFMDSEILGSYWGTYSIEKANREFIVRTLIAVAVLSIFGSIMGFVFWYKRLQIHLDRIHKLEVDKLENELDNHP